MQIVPETTDEYDNSGTRRRHLKITREYLRVQSFDETWQTLLSIAVWLAAARVDFL